MFSFTKIALAATAPLALTASAAPAQKRSYSGEATYFSVGLGACGWTNSDSDYVVALDSAIYSSSYCGKSVSITNTNTGTTQTGTVADECPTCSSSGSLDMSTALFEALGGSTEEGEFPITWSFA